MIKKIIFGVFVSLLGFISFSNAGKVQMIGLDTYPSIYNNQYNLSFLRGGAVLSNYLGQGKSILALNSNAFFWWSTDGRPYFYGPYSQGFFSTYCSCDVITDYDRTPENANCSCNPITGDAKALFKGFFSNVKQYDLAYYEYSDFLNSYTSCSQRRSDGKFCRSSSSIHSTLCLAFQGKCYNGCQGPTICNGMMGGGLVNSQGLENLTYGLIHDSRIGYAPGQNGYDGSRDNEENNTNNSITNVGSCPTIGQLMQGMGENYNTGLCYNNTTYYNGNTFEQVEKQDIFTIFNDDYQEYTNRISIYRNNCKTPATAQACQNAFSGEYKKYSIISNAINSNVDEKKLRNYCNYGLNYDPNTTTCVASGGGIKEPYNNEEIIENMVNNGIIVTPGNNQEGNTNNVINALNKCEDGERECYVNKRNFIDSLGNIYGKITGLFKERNGVNGIIPSYILRITFLTILFTVIFKK